MFSYVRLLCLNVLFGQARVKMRARANGEGKAEGHISSE